MEIVFRIKGLKFGKWLITNDTDCLLLKCCTSFIQRLTSDFWRVCYFSYLLTYWSRKVTFKVEIKAAYLYAIRYSSQMYQVSRVQ